MKTSIIICTYNEATTISEVVVACCKYNKDSEIIVVDDGSTDNTETILKELRIHYKFIYEKLPRNYGKSWAMVRGVEISSNEVILFCDADISNINITHFEVILKPILNKCADMVLGQPSETFINYKINPFKSLTGERAVLKKDILPILDDIREIKFGVETFINLYYQSEGKRIKYVMLEELKHPTKFDKTSSSQAAKKFAKERHQIALTIFKNFDLITKSIKNSISKSVNI